MMELRDRAGVVDAAAFAVLAVWVLGVAAPAALGDPPARGSTHGSRGKDDLPYLGYTGKTWSRDFGVLDGRCDRQAVGAVLGTARGGGRSIAILVGSVTGTRSRANFNGGRGMDEKDRACLAQALELAGAERTVAWTSTDTGTRYSAVPLDGYSEQGRSCREFVTRIAARGHDETMRHKACSAGDGVWRIVS